MVKLRTVMSIAVGAVAIASISVVPPARETSSVSVAQYARRRRSCLWQPWGLDATDDLFNT